jgi:Flp pilus assembly protein CpaB
VVKRGDEMFSKIILQNILVLAVDQMQTRPDDKPTLVGATVVVQVTPAQAETLSLATEMGTLRLILRPFGDDDKTKTVGALPKNLQGANAGNSEEAQDDEVPLQRSPVAAKAPAAAKTPEPPPMKRHTLTIYNGDAVTRAIYLLDEQDNAVATKIERSQSEPAPEAAAKAASPPTAAKP